MWPTEKIVNLVGSVASIIGFAVLIVGWFSSSGTRDAETILWQYVWFVVALVASAAIIVAFFFWIMNGLNKYPANTGMGIVLICLKLCLGILALGLAGDSMIAAIKWTIWPQIPVSFINVWWRAIFH
jgi:hypothetical protein